MRGNSVIAAAIAVTGAALGPFKTPDFTVQATVDGTGAVTAGFTVQVSNDPDLLAWIPLGTIALTGTTTATDGLACCGRWLFVRVLLTAITGTGAVANALVIGA